VYVQSSKKVFELFQERYNIECILVAKSFFLFESTLGVLQTFFLWLGVPQAKNGWEYCTNQESTSDSQPFGIRVPLNKKLSENLTFYVPPSAACVPQVENR
jgi:hypothetical protein